MAKMLNERLVTEYPDVIELNHLLRIAETTWPKYGLSAKDLSECQPGIVEIIKILAQ